MFVNRFIKSVVSGKVCFISKIFVCNQKRNTGCNEKSLDIRWLVVRFSLFVRFEVFTSGAMKNAVLRDVTLCGYYGYFGRECCLNYRGG
jgi:hypothetical protein